MWMALQGKYLVNVKRERKLKLFNVNQVELYYGTKNAFVLKAEFTISGLAPATTLCNDRPAPRVSVCYLVYVVCRLCSYK